MSRDWIKAAPCPKCSAGVGEPCVNARGQARMAHHNARRVAAAALRPEKPKGAGFVYFVLCSGTATIKIGFTASHPRKRQRGLQTGAPGELRLLVYAPGSTTDERRLHREFAHLHKHGEWFSYKEDLFAYVKQLIRSSDSRRLAPSLDVAP